MRVGANPAKTDPSVVRPYGKHRVIIPVYIPHQDGYFQRALEVVRLSLESLHLSGSGMAVSVVSNGCDAAVVRELTRLREIGWIEQLVLERHNRGKINALLSVARGAHEPFLTLADADILYFRGWQESVAGLFRAFPECGIISPLAIPKPNCRHASAAFTGAWLRRELRFESAMTLEHLQRHAQTMGKEFVYELNRQGQFVVRRGDALAVVGAPHMILTLRREVVETFPAAPVMKFDKAEENTIDTPPDMAGYWRLSLPGAKAAHMGNVPDEWIYEKMEELRREAGSTLQNTPQSTPDLSTPFAEIPAARRHWSGRLPWRWRRALARRLRRGLAPTTARSLFDKLP
jgi:hypothetical protein